MQVKYYSIGERNEWTKKDHKAESHACSIHDITVKYMTKAKNCSFFEQSWKKPC